VPVEEAEARLGHSSRVTATDAYVHVDEETVREAVVAYEAHVLAA